MNREDEIISWYHGKISRERTERLLKEGGQEDGTFLVRDSNTSAGNYVLSVLCQTEVVHYQIRKHGEDAFFSIDEHTTLHGLDSLIEYYQNSANGLVCQLTAHVKGNPPPHDTRRNGRKNLLHRATENEHYRVVSELINAKYQLEAKNQLGQTAVHIASQLGKDDILKKLLDNGASVNSRDTAGYTPLHYACQNNHTSTVRLLVQGGASVQARNTLNGRVPLHDAAACGHTEVVRALLSLNAPLNPRTNEEELPLELAKQGGHSECAQLLEDYETPPPKSKREDWYHGTLKREEAIKIVTDYGVDGCFLVRFSDRGNINYFVLTMLHESQTFHFVISSHENGKLFIDNGPYLDSLEHVIDHFSCMADGLPCTLTIPIRPPPAPPVPEFSTMPRHSRGEHPKERDEDIPIIADIEKYRADDDAYIINDNLLKLDYDNVLGEGEFGSVVKGLYGSQPVAVKTLHSEHSEANRDAFLSEARVMAGLNHHCIVRLIGISTKPTLRMIQELVSLGSMLAYLLDFPEYVGVDYELKLWAAQIACGMSYLEEKRFVHRDLAARNILLSSRHQAKISDFGLSRALGGDHNYYKAEQGGKWPIRWYAPESFNYGTFSHASDVWSYGVTLWEMFSYGQQPYGSKKGCEVINSINEGNRLECPSRCPMHIYDIMKKCWEYNPTDRPTFAELMNVFATDTQYANIQELLVHIDLNSSDDNNCNGAAVQL